MAAAVDETHGMTGRGGVELPARRMAALGEGRFVVAGGANPASRGRLRGLATQRVLDVGDGRDGGRRAVDGEEGGGVGEQVDVGVDEAGQERAAAAIDEGGAAPEGEDVGVGAGGDDAPVLDGDGFGAPRGARPGAVGRRRG